MSAPEGYVLYDFSNSVPSASHSAMSPFELFREPVMILGLVDGNEYNDSGIPSQTADQGEGDAAANEGVLSDRLENMLMDIREQNPKALVHQIIVIDHTGHESSANPTEQKKDILFISQGDREQHRAFLRNLTSTLLAELASYAKSIQALQIVPSPTISKTTMEASVNIKGAAPFSSSKAHNYSISSGLNSHADTSLSAINASQSRTEPNDFQPNLSLNGEQRIPATTFDGMTGLSSQDQSFAGSPAEMRKDAPSTIAPEKISVQGFGSGSLSEQTRNIAQARISILHGQLYLVSGHWTSALHETLQGVLRCKSLNDHLWHARGLENIFLCLLLQTWAGHKLEVCFANQILSVSNADIEIK